MADDLLARLAAEGRLAEVRRTPPPRAGTRTAPSAPFAPAVTAPPAPAPVRAPVPPPVAAAPRIVLSSGAEVVVDGTGVIGRDPSATPGDYRQRIALDDPRHLLSRGHLEFGSHGDGAVWVSDLHSTNGVFIRRGGGDPQRLAPGTRVALAPGDVVQFGDAWLRRA